MVLHEWAHALIQRVEGAHVGHDAAFLCVNLAIRLRADVAGASPATGYSLVSMASLYDLADADLPDSLHDDPDHGVGRCVTWSITTAHELAPTNLSAEALACKIVERYQAWLVDLADQPRRAELATAKVERGLQKQVEAVTKLKDRLFVSNFVAALSLVFLLLLALMQVRV